MRSEDDVRAALNFPVLATIPLIVLEGPSRRLRVAVVSLTSAALIAGIAFAAFRYLR
jgi:hypothetical protein